MFRVSSLRLLFTKLNDPNPKQLETLNNKPETDKPACQDFGFGKSFEACN